MDFRGEPEGAGRRPGRQREAVTCVYGYGVGKVGGVGGGGGTRGRWVGAR